jgi:hypothetical protein
MSAILLGAAPVFAHDHTPPSDTSGIAIPNISHGEMAILASYRAEIVALAHQVRQPQPDFTTLLRYTGIQYADCLWGVVPGSISDEASPFNECSHAYLAASKALLLTMRSLPEVGDKAESLISRIDAEVTLTGAAFIGCLYSGEEFNTASLVRPQWLSSLFHPPTLLTLLALFLGPVGVSLAASRMARTATLRRASA